jgi:serine protease Do
MEGTSFSHRDSHIIMILLAALLGAVGTLAALYGFRGKTVAVGPVQAQSTPATALEQRLVEVAAQVLPAVVNISAERVTRERLRMPPDIEEFFRRFPFPFEFRFGPEGEESEGSQGSEGEEQQEAPQVERRGESLGSGWIYSEDGYVVTNSHVVQGASEIRVTPHDLPNDDRSYPARLIGSDLRSELAVLKIDAGRKLPTLKLGDSDAVKVGQICLAIGAPFGFHLQQTVTMGIVSAKGRVLPGQTKYIRIGDVIQTDAAINPGNSGGPLVNLQGEVIGINVAIISPGYQVVPGNVGIGFAIPSNTAAKVIPELIKHGKVARGWLGISIEDLTPNMRDFYGCPQGGALVTGIQPDGPAAKSDLKEEDVIVALDGQPIHDTWELQKAVADRKPGTTVRLDVVRNKKRLQVTLQLGEMPAKYAGTEIAKQPTEQRRAVYLGIRVAEITPQLRQSLNLPAAKGVVILRVDPDSPAAGSLQRGDIITKINQAPITSLEDYQNTLEEARKAKAKFLIIHFTRRLEDGEVMSGVVDITPNW